MVFLSILTKYRRVGELIKVQKERVLFVLFIYLLVLLNLIDPYTNITLLNLIDPNTNINLCTSQINENTIQDKF